MYEEQLRLVDLLLNCPRDPAEASWDNRSPKKNLAKVQATTWWSSFLANGNTQAQPKGLEGCSCNQTAAKTKWLHPPGVTLLVHNGEIPNPNLEWDTF